jgi:sporulation protein YlmC with PRC-barrel domain
MGAMHIKLDELPGRTMLDANGRVVGRVKAALVDVETWLIDTLRVRISRQAAMEMNIAWSFWRRRPTMDLPTGLIQAAADAIILRVSLGELRESPPRDVSEPASAFASVH